MKFSAYSLMQWPDSRTPGDAFRDELEQMCEADVQGYHSAWLAEHHFSRYGVAPAIHLNAAHLAARTRTIKIGAAVTILPFMHPLRLAEEVAMLDILSGGRLMWGAGQGYEVDDLSASEADNRRAHEIFCEQLEVIGKAWTGESFDHGGEFFQFSELQCFPNPVQRPGPPVYISAANPSTLEWAAVHGYPVLGDAFSPDSRLAGNRQLYLGHAEKAQGVTVQREIPTLRHVYVGESMAKAREEAAPGLLDYSRSLVRTSTPNGESGAARREADSFHRFFGEEGRGLERDPEVFLEFLFERCTIVGDAAYCRDRIAELRESTGLDHLIAWQNFGNLSHTQSMASQKRLIDRVAPAFS